MVEGVSAIGAASTTNTASSSTTTSTPVNATIAALPSNLLELLQQTQMPATVTSVTSSDTITVNTAQGPLTLSLAQLSGTQQQNITQQLAALLSTQRSLTIIIQPGTPPNQAILLLPTVGVSQALSGQLQTQSQFQYQPETSPVLEAPAVISVDTPVTVGTTLTAIVLPSTTPSSSLGSSASEEIARESLTSPLVSPPPISLGIENNQSIPDGISNSLSVGTTVSLFVNQISPNGGSPIIVPQNSNQFVATVETATTNGQIILSAGEALLYIKESVTASTGSTFLLTIEPTKAVNITVLPPTLHALPSLPDVLASLIQTDPKVMSDIFDTRIPQFNSNLSSALLFFMSSLKQGNPWDWLGNEAFDALSYGGKNNLINKFMQELANIGQDAKDSVVGEWKSYPLPIYTGNHFQMFDFYVHNNPDRPFKNASPLRAGSGYLRFLIDMHMSKLGSIQLDGLVQPKKLDIIMRSEQALPSGLYQELREIYIRTLGGIDYQGSLGFQVGRQHWLNIQKNVSKAATIT